MLTVCVVGLLDVIPVAVEYTDLACSCGDEEFIGTALCQGKSVECWVSRFTIFLMMSISYTIAGTVIRLLLNINRQRSLLGIFDKVYYLIFGFLIPLGCAFAAGFLDFQVMILP
jgi:hypothetical protein